MGDQAKQGKYSILCDIALEELRQVEIAVVLNWSRRIIRPGSRKAGGRVLGSC